MATLYSQSESNVWKTWGLMSTFFVLIILFGWFTSIYFGDPAILYVFVGFSIFMNILSYWYSDTIVLKMSGANEVSRDSHRDLWNVVENLCITAGMQMPKLHIITDSAPNAFATGRDEEHSAVAVTSGLLAMLERSELEGVIAHELSHIQNKDILLQTVVVILVGFVTLLSDFLLRWSFYGNGGGNKDGRARMIMMIGGLVLAILAPLVASIIQLAISRKREFLADSSGALLTRYPEGLASALEKISGYGGEELKHANHATAHLYISNPFNNKHGQMSFMKKLFMTHPPTSERVQALRESLLHSRI